MNSCVMFYQDTARDAYLNCTAAKTTFPEKAESHNGGAIRYMETWDNSTEDTQSEGATMDARREEASRQCATTS